MDWNQVIGGGFVIGAIFWAGATYSRIVRIEKDLGSMVAQLVALGKLGAMQAAIHTHDREIVMLRKTVYGKFWKQHNADLADLAEEE